MTLDEYQKAAFATNLTKEDKFLDLMQNVLGLADESGEVLALFKKWIRDQLADLEALDKDKMTKEIGDVLWYIAVVSQLLEIPLEDVAQQNIDKLRSRHHATHYEEVEMIDEQNIS